MMADAQLAFGFGAPRPAFGREAFLVSPCNAEAVAAVDRWPQWPHAAFVLCGPEGAGKSHLGEVWRVRSGAQPVSLAAFAAHRVSGAGDGRAWLVDGVEAAAPLGAAPETARAQEVALCRALDAMAATGESLLLIAREGPGVWQVGLPDLRTRLARLAVVELSAPDEMLLESLVAKLFQDRQLAVQDSIVREVVAHTGRSFRAVRAAVEAIDHASLARGPRALSRALVQEVLQAKG